MNSYLTDHAGETLHLNNHYVRHGNRVIDASSIASVRVKKNKILFNSFKENTTLPTLAVTFKKDSDAVHALNQCLALYEHCDSNPFYFYGDHKDEVYLVDAYGTVLTVAPTYLKYRNRILSSNDVTTVQVKNRKILVNNHKGNHMLPTLCVHFADKDAAQNALNNILSIVWNVPTADVEKPVYDEEEEVPTPMSNALHVLESPLDNRMLMVTLFGTFAVYMLALVTAALTMSRGNRTDEL